MVKEHVFPGQLQSPGQRIVETIGDAVPIVVVGKVKAVLWRIRDRGLEAT